MELSLISMGWFKGKSTGNNVFPHQIWGFPLDFPLNQSNDIRDNSIYKWMVTGVIAPMLVETSIYDWNKPPSYWGTPYDDLEPPKKI